MVFNLVTGLLDSVFGVIDKSITDKDKVNEIKAQLKMEMLNQESQLVKSATAIIEAEAKSESWLTRSWRPLTMLTFLGLLCSYWVGLAPDYLVNNPQLVEKLFTLLQVGIGGYIIGRSAEKGIKTWKETNG